MNRPVLLDVDVGCDDAVAIAMALGSPAIDVVGITTVQGNTTIQNTTRNTRSVLELFDRTDVPVARGANRPLTRAPITAEEVHGPNGIRGDMPEPTQEIVDEHAVSFILDIVDQYGDELTICSIGPQTNLALALAQRPDLADEIGSLYLMGGAAIVSRTLGGGFNFKNDPEATSRVFQECRPTMVGIDVTYHAPVPFERIDRLEQRGEPFSTIAEWMRYPEDVISHPAAMTGETVRGPVVHDAVVIADVIADVLTVAEYYVEVTTGDGPAAGRVVCDYARRTDNRPNAAVAVDVDSSRYEEVFAEAIAGVV